MSKENEGNGRTAEEEATAMGMQTLIDTVKLYIYIAYFRPDMAKKWFEIGLKLGCRTL